MNVMLMWRSTCCDVAAQHLKPRHRAHVNEYFSFHLAALIIGRVEKFISELKQEIKHFSSAPLRVLLMQERRLSLPSIISVCALAV